MLQKLKSAAAMLPRALLLGFLLLPALAGAALAQAGQSIALRGLWVPRWGLENPAWVARMVDDAARAGFTALFVQVDGRGEAYYRSSLLPPVAGQSLLSWPLDKAGRELPGYFLDPALPEVKAFVTGGRVPPGRPRILVSAAVFPDLDEARRLRGQDWPRWLADGDLDFVAPMAYTASNAALERYLTAEWAGLPAERIYPGLGAYKFGTDQAGFLSQLQAVQGHLPAGLMVYSYQSLQEMSGVFPQLAAAFAAN
ncbi:MAG: hypothetical protein ACM3RP_11345 [Chitinophagales bacterium]